MVDKFLVFINDDLAGYLTKADNGFIFRYDDVYYQDQRKKPISVTFPKTQQEYKSSYLFPFFFNMLSEGTNRRLQCRQLQIDENDYFGLLQATCNNETIGAVTVRPIKN